MHRDEHDELDEYDTLEEALAVAMDGMEEGGTVTVHAEDCQSDDGETNCTCEPLTLNIGARA